jgi:hypothetical protein
MLKSLLGIGLVMTIAAPALAQSGQPVACSFKTAPKVTSCQASATSSTDRVTIAISAPGAPARTLIFKGGEFYSINPTDEVTSTDTGKGFKVVINRGKETFDIPSAMVSAN